MNPRRQKRYKSIFITIWHAIR